MRGTVIAAATPSTTARPSAHSATLRHGTGGTSTPFGGVQTWSQAPRIPQRDSRGSVELAAECILEVGLVEGVPKLLQFRWIGIRALGDRGAHLPVQHLDRERRNWEDR